MMRVYPTAFLLLTLALSCGKPSHIKEMEKKQINQLLEINLITMTVDERQYFDTIKDNHMKRLDFLYDVAQQEKTRGIALLIPAKISALQTMQETIKTDKLLYKVECMQAKYDYATE